MSNDGEGEVWVAEWGGTAVSNKPGLVADEAVRNSDDSHELSCVEIAIRGLGANK